MFWTLMSIGIQGPLLKYFQSFLSPRPFQIRIGNTTLPTFLSHRGTPQGSILSPILILLAIDGVSRLIPPSIRISLYADDLAVYTHTKDPGQAQPLLQTFINRLVSWSMTSGLSLNPSKCTSFKWSFINSDRPPSPLSYYPIHCYTPSPDNPISRARVGSGSQLVIPHQLPPIRLFPSPQYVADDGRHQMGSGPYLPVTLLQSIRPLSN
jgi:hypothetical protein